MADTATVNKWGNSQGVRLPKSYCERLKLSVGDEVLLSFEDGKIIIASLAEQHTLLSRMKAWDNKRLETDEFDWGRPVGKEVW
jgi:antitoxin MazE